MKSRKILFRIVASLFLITAIGLFFLSSIARNYLVKNGERLIGRKVHLGALHLNYATVSVKAEDFVLFEKNRVDTFVSFRELKINAEPWRLLQNEYALSEFFLDSLFVNVKQDGERFNFDDLIPASDSTAVDTLNNSNNEDLRFSFENIQIKNGSIDYFDSEVNNNLSFHNLNLELPLLAWNNKQSEVGAEFEVGERGHLAVNADVYNEKEAYVINAKIDSVDLRPFSNYLKPYMNASEMEGLLSSNIAINGSLTDYFNILFSGDVNVSNFSLKDDNGGLVFSAKAGYVQLDSLDLLNQYYHIGRAEVTGPQIIVELGKEKSNLEYFFAPLLVEDSITSADSLVTAVEESAPLRYMLDSVKVHEGSIFYVDNSLNRPFNYKVSSINLNMSNLADDAEKVPVTFDMLLNDKGSLNGNSSFNMADPYQFSFNGSLKKLELTSFSPYSEYFIAYPIRQGEFNYDCRLEMSQEKLINNNGFYISELELGRKTKDTTAIKSPVRLALYILKDKDDNISFELPVRGNPSEPEFSVRKIVWRTLSNFMVKTASEPFSLLAGIAGTSAESIQQMKISMTQDTLSDEQLYTLDKLAEIMDKKPDLLFTLTQETPADDEMRELAFKKVCGDYLIKTRKPTTKSDSLIISAGWEKVNRSDADFISYVVKKSGMPDTVPLADKCMEIVGQEALKEKFLDLVENRNKAVQRYLTDVRQIDSTSVIVQTADLINLRVQENDPIFRVEVSVKENN